MKNEILSSLNVAVCVWPVLMFINNYQSAIHYQFSFLFSFSSLLTFVVPFCVSMHSRVDQRKKNENNKIKEIKL